MPPYRAIEERFWEKVDVRGEDECWEWQASKTANGYGLIALPRDGKLVLAHRLSWEFANGPILPGLFVCHTCDNPLCVNPAHLFLACNAGNMRDAAKKGRMACGERNGQAKLSDEEVGELRARHATGGIMQRELAEKFGVSRPTISKIISGKTWGHVGGPRRARP